VHLFGKFWIVVALIPFWGAVIAVLIHRLRGDSKLQGSSTRSENQAQTGEKDKPLLEVGSVPPRPTADAVDRSENGTLQLKERRKPRCAPHYLHHK